MGKFLDKSDGPLNAAMREIEGALKDMTPGQRQRLWADIQDAGEVYRRGIGRAAALSYRRRRGRR